MWENIHAFLEREVKAHVTDAWIDETKTKVSYEIPFNRRFCRYTPPRPLEATLPVPLEICSTWPTPNPFSCTIAAPWGQQTINVRRIMTDMSKHLDKAYETKTFEELADAPVDALEGVSADDAELLRKAFNIRTIRDLAESKFVLRAQAIVNLARVHAAKRKAA
jgi:hypothetical protein